MMPAPAPNDPRPVEVALPDPAATEQLGRVLARHVRRGLLVALWGPLGAGKTTLARAILRALGHAGEVPSPSFTLVQSYETPGGTVTHADLYRLSGPGETEELGLDAALAEGVLLLEWPDRMGELLPEDRIDVRLAGLDTGRRASLSAHGAARGLLALIAGEMPP